MQGNGAVGLFLNTVVATHVITVGVGINDQRRATEIQAEASENFPGVFPIPKIGRVDQDGAFGPIGKMVGVQVSTLDKEEFG